MRFIIGTSYFNGPNSGSDWFYQKLWVPAVLRLFQGHRRPEVVNVICVAGCEPPFELHENIIRNFEFSLMKGDLGHIHQFIGKKQPAKNNELSSWEASVLTLAMHAYTNECDFIFLEQDCLAFGDWVQQLYQELLHSGKQMLFGKSRCMPCAQSLFIIKHAFITTFVWSYIQNVMGSRLGEDKFVNIERALPEVVGRFSFGYDRDRPINYNDPVWYGQKFSREELETMKTLGLIQFDSLPDNVGKFTNDC